MDNEMKTISKTTSHIVDSIAAAVLLLSAQISHAGSATWLSSPEDSAWENPNNWTPGGPPNGPSDIATFAQSSQTGVNISMSEEVNSILFAANSTTYVFTIGACNGNSCQGQLIISGTGVTNNSSVFQTFEARDSGQIIFNNASTAGGTLIANASTDLNGPGDIGRTIFNGASTADHATITNYGPYFSHDSGGQTIFNDTSTAANASIDNFGTPSTADSGRTIFNDASTAGHATITNQGDLGFGGATIFNGSSTADSAILVADGMDAGGGILFSDTSTGGTARVEVFDNGSLDISSRQPGVTIGSIEGSGNVYLGANRLTVGTNNINTSFSGVISGTGLLSKIGSGILTLQANDCVADSVGLVLVSGSTIKLDFAGAPDVIASLKVNGVLQPPGIYGGPMSGAPHILPEFEGLGTVEAGPISTLGNISTRALFRRATTW
jgi:hypothetical protein